MAVQFPNIYNVEVTKGPAVKQLSPMFYADKAANRIGANLFKNGQPYSPGGSCAGTAVLSNGTTVALTGVITGNQAYVDLTQACYSVPGPIRIFVSCVGGTSSITTVVAGFGTVTLTETGTIIDPGTIIPSVAALIAQIENAVASIPADYTTLLGSIAHTFSQSASYTAGKYVWYNGELYRFNVDHPAGAWIGTDAARYTATDEYPLIEQVLGTKADAAEVADLKSAITKAETALDAVYPNLWDCSYADYSANGITFKKNSDGTYSVKGTATALFYRQQSVTLPAGRYYIYGFSDGSTATYHILVGGVGSNAYQTNRFSKITLAAETTITLTMRVMNGTSVDTTFKPMIVEAAYNGIDFVPYGGAYFPKTVDDKIDAVEDLTGYTKPNLFNNTISTQTQNGLTFTVNADKSITVTGTATAFTAPNVKFTLPRGKYILNGCNGGSSQSYHIAILKTGSSTFSAIQYGGTDYPFEITEDTQEVTLYVRVLNRTTVNDTLFPMVRSASVYNQTYAPYGEYQVYKPIQQLIDYTQFNWSGKKMNVIGDSIVAGSYGNFIIPIRDILCLSEARNYGVGGSCLASSSADSQYPPAVLRYTSMDTDAQIIIVHAGTNDYSAQIPLGASDSTDITTFNGALNVMMAGLREMYPTALIIFDSILHRFNDGALPIPASAYREAIENRCLANHVVFYDAYKYSGFDFVKGYYDHILTSDGLHPNQTGANILGRKLAGFIRWN